jgi:hypothetical protein
MSPLEPEVEELLAELVEWVRSVPRGSGRTIIVSRTHSGTSMILSGSGRSRPVVWEDIETLIHVGLLRRTGGSALEHITQVTPDGFAHYEEYKQRAGAPAAAVQADVVAYLDGRDFAKRHAGAHAKWKKAVDALWSSDREGEFTSVGHHAREAMQVFATECVAAYHVTAAPPEIEKSINRVWAVYEVLKPKIGDREATALEALINVVEALLRYWETVNGLAQRQVHGNTRDVRLTWEDGRRLVFALGFAMFELDRSFERELGG